MKNASRFYCLLLCLVLALSLVPALGEGEDVVTYTGFAVYKDDDHHTMEDSLAFRDTLEKYGIKFDIDFYSSTVAAEKRNLLLSSGDYPDIFFCGVDIEW